MTWHHFYAGDGTPVTGKTPVRIRYVGDKRVADTHAAEVHSFLNVFHEEIRLGKLNHLSREVRTASGVVVLAVHAFGETKVVVTANDPREESERLIGGILIAPTWFATEVLKNAYFNTANSTTFAPRTTPPDLKQSGYISPSMPGRPNMPGTTHEDEVDHLLVQISGKKKLVSGRAISSGAVQIFRIKNPKYGAFVEITEEKRFLVSAAGSPAVYGGTPAGFSEFYLCGKKLKNVPPIPLTLNPTGYAQYYRVRTFALHYESFELADEATGIFIVAIANRLFAIHAVSPSSEWVLLAEDPASPGVDAYNDFGVAFTEEVVEEGVTRITCGGTNGAGPCSGFEVNVAYLGENTPPVLTGSLKRELLAFIPEKPPTSMYIKTLSFSNTYLPAKEYSDSGITELAYDCPNDGCGCGIAPGDVPPGWVPEDCYKGSAFNAACLALAYVRSSSMFAQSSYAGTTGVARQDYDKFAGGLVPVDGEVTFTYSWNTSRVVPMHDYTITKKAGYYTSSRGGVGLWGPGTGGGGPITQFTPIVTNKYAGTSCEGCYEYEGIFDWNESWDGACNVVGGVLGSRTLLYSYTKTGQIISYSPNYPPACLASYSLMPTTEGKNATTPNVVSGAIEVDQKTRFRYFGHDFLMGALAWQEDFQRPGTWLGMRAAGLLGNNGFGIFGGEWSVYDGVIEYGGACTWSAALIDRTKKPVFEVSNLLSLIPGTVYQSGPVTDTASTTFVGVVPQDYPATSPTTPRTSIQGDTMKVFWPFAEHNLPPWSYAWVPDGGSPPTEFTDEPVQDLTLSMNGLPANNSRASWVAAFPSSLFADPGYLPEITKIEYAASQQVESHYKHPLNAKESRWFTTARMRPNMQSQDDILLRDPRTGGYITQIRWHGYGQYNGVWGTRAGVRTYIGNEFGAIPLVDVLNEWKKKGEEVDNPYDYVFVNNPNPNVYVALL